MAKQRTLPLRVGLVGCGNVSDVYFQNAKSFVREFKIIACASRTPATAKAKACTSTCLCPEAMPVSSL